MLVRTGRPPIENPKDYRVTIRIDKGEKEMLETICKVTKSGKNESIRTAIKKYYEHLTK